MTTELKKLINPKRFIEWLKLEGETITGNYNNDVYNMCQIGSLYISMILHDSPYKNRFHVNKVFHKYVWHYFVTYIHDGSELIIDLTIGQFYDDYPKLLLKPVEEVKEIYGQSVIVSNIIDYVRDSRGFETYINPITLIKPEQWINNNNVGHDWRSFNNLDLEIELKGSLEGFLI